MSRHLQSEIETLKKRILHLGAVVEEAVHKAVKACMERNVESAESVISGDIEIDQLEVEFEEECLKILALYQPVAADLRFIIAIMKINNDLERIGDLAAHIASKAAPFAKNETIAIPPELEEMAGKCRHMLKGSLDALVNLDTTLARTIGACDDEVDEINRHISQRVRLEIRKQPEQLDGLMGIISVARNVERIADHATNIAEDLIYLVEGDIVRHKMGAVTTVKKTTGA